MAADDSEDTANAAEVFDAPMAAPIDESLLASDEVGTIEAPAGLADAPSEEVNFGDVEEAKVVEEVMPEAPVMEAPIAPDTKEA